MKTLLLVLALTAFAASYPLGETPDISKLPIVSADYSTVQKATENKAEQVKVDQPKKEEPAPFVAPIDAVKAEAVPEVPKTEEKKDLVKSEEVAAVAPIAVKADEKKEEEKIEKPAEKVEGKSEGVKDVVPTTEAAEIPTTVVSDQKKSESESNAAENMVAVAAAAEPGSEAAAPVLSDAPAKTAAAEPTPAPATDNPVDSDATTVPPVEKTEEIRIVRETEAVKDEPKKDQEKKEVVKKEEKNDSSEESGEDKKSEEKKDAKSSESGSEEMIMKPVVASFEQPSKNVAADDMKELAEKKPVPAPVVSTTFLEDIKVKPQPKPISS